MWLTESEKMKNDECKCYEGEMVNKERLICVIAQMKQSEKVKIDEFNDDNV
jgi:hypothetical protein